ncbi:MAG: hypothetical protein ACFWT0_09020 [Bifidobacterium crudilactis]|jgi:hypothetical protein
MVTIEHFVHITLRYHAVTERPPQRSLPNQATAQTGFREATGRPIQAAPLLTGRYMEAL